MSLHGVHIDSHLNWCEHINHIKSDILKNVSIMHLLIGCEIWGNTYNSRVQSLHNIIQKRAIRICQKTDYRSHSRPLFYQLKTLNVHDMVNFKSMVFIFKVYSKLLPANIMSYFFF